MLDVFITGNMRKHLTYRDCSEPESFSNLRRTDQEQKIADIISVISRYISSHRNR